MEQRDYTVCLLLTKDHKEVLLQVKKDTDFAGMLNGVGGKVELGETPEECALRKIREETSLPGVESLSWAGTLFLGDNCDNHQHSTDPMTPACVLYYYTGEIAGSKEVQAATCDEPLQFYSVDAVLRSPVGSSKFAGEGNLQYFLQRSLHVLEGKAQSLGARREIVTCPQCGQTYTQVTSQQAQGSLEWSDDVCPHCGKKNGGSLLVRYQNSK